ncbi:MAG: hypothetical protein FJ280_24570 [Planctomycetes bacterium]|nr:hypothetical protein [Planctomycetota bacterium]
MKRLRISGLVSLAKRVRQELAGPVSPARLAGLRREVENALAAIEGVLKENRVGVRNLPSPSRKALQFLQGLDWGAVATDASAGGDGLPPESVSFRGLPRHFDGLLDRLAQAAQPSLSWPSRPLGGEGGSLPDRGQDVRDTEMPATRGRDARDTQERLGPLEEVYETIVSDSARMEQEIQVQDIRPEQLTRQAREIRGWLAYFAQRENFERYCAAVRRAEPVFRTICTWPASQGMPVRVRFRPLHALYRVRGYPDRLQVDLPTPMICFDRETLRSVAQAAFRQEGSRKAMHEAAGGEAYRRIDAAIELLAGVVAQMRGLHHDLAASFDRVNAAYFDERLSWPRLVWSHSFAARKFGHYDHAHDTVMVNAVLDRDTVPALVVDFIVYHELLHRELGITWKNNRIAAHTPKLAARERQFEHYDQAKAVLRKLASER